VMFQAAFPTEAFAYPGSHMRAVREAFAAKGGVIAARLAAAGVEAFDRPLEAPGGFFGLVTEGEINTARLMQGLGMTFDCAEVSFKPWPSCRGTHAFIEAALNLSEAHGVRPDDVVHADTVVSPFFRALVEPPARKQRPETAIDAKFSIPFTVAAALHDGRVTLDSFAPDAIRNPNVLDLASRVGHIIESSWPTVEATRGDLRLQLRDGREFSMSIKDPLGHPANPMSAQAFRSKFTECARHAHAPLPPGGADTIAATIDRLETINNLTGLLS